MIKILSLILVLTLVLSVTGDNLSRLRYRTSRHLDKSDSSDSSSDAAKNKTAPVPPPARLLRDASPNQKVSDSSETSDGVNEPGTDNTNTNDAGNDDAVDPVVSPPPRPLSSNSDAINEPSIGSAAQNNANSGNNAVPPA